MKIFFTLITAVLLSYNVSAQDKEKIEALKIAHITNEVEMSTNEAQKFWPAYNSYEEKRQALRKEKGNLRNQLKLNTLSETEAKTLVNKMLSFEKEEINLKTNYITSLQSIISNKKIIKLFEAERSFKLKMIKEFKGRHKK